MALREQVKRKIIEKKYFREPTQRDPEERRLTWAEKEQIRHLYTTDPQAWNFDILAEQFKIDVEVFCC